MYTIIYVRRVRSTDYEVRIYESFVKPGHSAYSPNDLGLLRTPVRGVCSFPLLLRLLRTACSNLLV